LRINDSKTREWHFGAGAHQPKSLETLFRKKDGENSSTQIRNGQLRRQKGRLSARAPCIRIQSEKAGGRKRLKTRVAPARCTNGGELPIAQGEINHFQEGGNFSRGSHGAPRKERSHGPRGPRKSISQVHKCRTSLLLPIAATQ